MHTCNEKKQPLLIISAGVFILTYLIQIYCGRLGYINQQPITQIIILAVIVASTSALISLVFHVVVSNFKYTDKPNNYIEKNFTTLSTLKLFEICDNLSNDLHSLIEELLPLPDFESDFIDESSQQISRSRLAPCTAYSYGIIVLCMNVKDPFFFQSSENTTLQSYALKCMLRITKETDEAIGLGDAYNQDISSLVARDIKHMMHCIDFYKTTKDSDIHNPLAKFIVFLSKRISKDLLKNSPQILSFTQNQINKTTLLINKF